MNTNKKGFTLIELLVVIVIIGILATISVATFGGYFKKARDAERQSTVQNVATIMKVINATEETVDYSIGTTITDNLPADLNTKLAAQGYSVPVAKNNVSYIYAFSNDNQDFVVGACSEENPTDLAKAFLAGTPDGIASVTGGCTAAGTTATPAAPTSYATADGTTVTW